MTQAYANSNNGGRGTETWSGGGEGNRRGGGGRSHSMVGLQSELDEIERQNLLRRIKSLEEENALLKGIFQVIKQDLNWSEDTDDERVRYMLRRKNKLVDVLIRVKNTPVHNEQRVPLEVWKRIFAFCDVKTVCKSCQVSRSWYRNVSDFIESERYWKQLYLSIWGEPSSKSQDGETCFSKEVVRKRLELEKNWRACNATVRTLYGHDGTITSIIRPDDNTLVSGSDDGSMIVWSLEDSTVRHPCIPSSWSPSSLRSHSDLRNGVDSSNNVLMQQHHRQTRGKVATRLHSLHGHGGAVFSCHGERDIVVSGSYDKTVKVWHLSTGNCLQTMRGHQSWVSSVSFSYDLQRVISGSWDSTIRIWDCQASSQVSVLNTTRDNAVYSVDWNARKAPHHLITGCRSKQVQLWDITRGELLCNFEGHGGDVHAVHQHMDHPQRFVSGSNDNSVKLWDKASKSHVATFMGHTFAVMAVKYDGQYRIVSSSCDKTVRVWDTRMQSTPYYQWTGNANPGTSNNTLQAHSGAVFSLLFDENLIITGAADKSIKLFYF